MKTLPSERKDAYANRIVSFFLYSVKKKSTISLIQQRQFDGTCARRDGAVFFSPFCVVDQSKSIGGHWEWDSSEITALSRTHLTPLIETLVQKALKRRPASVLQRLPRTTRTSLPLGEKCICREKGAQPFSVAAAFVQSATRFLPSFLLNRPRSRAEEGGKFTARWKKLSARCINRFSTMNVSSRNHYSCELHTIYDDFIPK